MGEKDPKVAASNRTTRRPPLPEMGSLESYRNPCLQAFLVCSVCATALQELLAQLWNPGSFGKRATSCEISGDIFQQLPLHGGSLASASGARPCAVACCKRRRAAAEDDGAASRAVSFPPFEM